MNNIYKNTKSTDIKFRNIRIGSDNYAYDPKTNLIYDFQLNIKKVIYI